MAITEAPETRSIPTQELLQEKERPFLPPLYKELLPMAPPEPELHAPDAGVKLPSEENLPVYRQMAAYLRERLSGMPDRESRLQYLGLTPIEAGHFRKGTNAPIPDRRWGFRHDETPQRESEVPYRYFLGTTLVPNLLYEIGSADMGGFQVRTHQTPTHMHPAVNVMQGNAETFLTWLGNLADVDLRLPTEDEWELVAGRVGGEKEYIYGTDEPVKGDAHTFNPETYHTHPVDADSYPVNEYEIFIGGNVWEMTVPNLEQDFNRIESTDGSVMDGTYYIAKGGGFQHCSLGTRHAQRMICDPILRSASLGFRMAAAETYEENPEGGWRRRTRAFSSPIIFKESGFPYSTVQVVQTRNTRGLSIQANGKALGIEPKHLSFPEGPRRANALFDGKTFIYQTEHVLGALAGLGIWNAKIVVDGSSAPPAADFSAKEFTAMVLEADIIPGSSRRLRVNEDLVFEKEGSRCVITPGSPFYRAKIDFPNPAIGIQEATFDPTSDDFSSQIAPARTFVRSRVDEGSWETIRTKTLHDLPEFEHLSKAPLLVATADGWATPLRFPNEPARHKLLDMLGDLALLGAPIEGQIAMEKPGHQFNLWVVGKVQQLIEAGDPRITERA